MANRSSPMPEWLIRANFEQALRCHQQGDLAQAQRLYEWVLEAAPHHAPSQNYLGVIALQEGRIQDALRWLGLAIEHDPGELTYRVHWAAAQVQAQDHQVAVQACREILAQAPEHVGTLQILGDALAGLARHQEALQAYDAALSQAPDSVALWLNRGNALQSLRQYEAAHVSFSRALALNPAAFPAWLSRGNNRLGQGLWDEAVADYEQALRLQPGSPEALVNLGNAHLSRRQWSQALACFDQVATASARAEALKCLYELGHHDALFERVRRDQHTDRHNVRSASIMSFVSHQLKRDNLHRFCPSPLGMVRHAHLRDHEADDHGLIRDLLTELLSVEAVWNPLHQATQSGYQTASSLFRHPQGAMARLAAIIQQEVALYRQAFAHVDCQLMADWPEEHRLEGWFVRLRKSGFQKTHIHPEGWISGVIYLQTVPGLGQDEGAIEFGLHGDDLTVHDPDYPRLIHQPGDGDMVLFPSSLFHRTIPFSADDERMIVAFDVVPQRPRQG